MIITTIKITENYPYHLLLLADETIEAINKYLFQSDVYLAIHEERPVGVFCLYPIDAHTTEIKNIAIDKDHQRLGIGSYLLAEAARLAKAQAYKVLIVGTPDGAIPQIAFYKKNGFIPYSIRKNFFLENYELPIYENGIQLKDMLMLKKNLTTAE